ncbi:lef6 [Lambdina fiscellaria nucleopolyhedrovirus]|uniref:Lef6 n=1 Tax=Lambdina fiscellaria nucleopolyhedrovirus TaxID=1642929 RepID=A0A0E3URD5_9ABAC|nr:lef6 [Lambdina fiscellaria nucleopolyhedrovirus]AKC91745.1 lef6 [Lambdina fiscellaria nucleopolyhedrovirus]
MSEINSAWFVFRINAGDIKKQFAHIYIDYVCGGGILHHIETQHCTRKRLVVRSNEAARKLERIDRCFWWPTGRRLRCRFENTNTNIKKLFVNGDNDRYNNNKSGSSSYQPCSDRKLRRMHQQRQQYERRRQWHWEQRSRQHKNLNCNNIDKINTNDDDDQNICKRNRSVSSLSSSLSFNAALIQHDSYFNKHCKRLNAANFITDESDYIDNEKNTNGNNKSFDDNADDDDKEINDDEILQEIDRWYNNSCVKVSLCQDDNVDVSDGVDDVNGQDNVDDVDMNVF